MVTSIDKVGVIGAGQMGTGIALVCAQAGLDVALNDIAEERVHAALATINGSLSRQIAKGQLDEAGRQTILERIGVAATNADLAKCDLVIDQKAGQAALVERGAVEHRRQHHQFERRFDRQQFPAVHHHAAAEPDR